eukprot:SAG31_NODE_5243_length_2654_cov_3.037965_2_plen_93_part_00
MPSEKFNEAVSLLAAASKADSQGKKDPKMKLQAAVLYSEVLPQLIELGQRASSATLCWCRRGLPPPLLSAVTFWPLSHELVSRPFLLFSRQP